MIQIRRILVGVELHPKRAEITTGSAQALRQAVWLAREQGAELVLLHSTWRDGDDDVQQPEPEERLGDEARAALEAAASDAAAPAGEDGPERQRVGDAAPIVRLALTAKRPWLAIVRRVLRGEADLVVVGKRDEVATDGRNLGAVAVKLLRKCPAPVWLVKPEHDLVHKLVLAATDLTPVGDRAVRYGAFVAERASAKFHVVHAYQIPMSLQLGASHMSEEEYQAELDALKSKAQSRIDGVISATSFDGESLVHVGRNTPSLAIREAVEHFQPDLLVMGTVSRGGIAGFLVGNTAERLLDRVDCSLLTVKPEDFVCPVGLE